MSPNSRVRQALPSGRRPRPATLPASAAARPAHEKRLGFPAGSERPSGCRLGAPAAPAKGVAPAPASAGQPTPATAPAAGSAPTSSPPTGSAAPAPTSGAAAYRFPLLEHRRTANPRGQRAYARPSGVQQCRSAPPSSGSIRPTSNSLRNGLAIGEPADRHARAHC